MADRQRVKGGWMIWHGREFRLLIAQASVTNLTRAGDALVHYIQRQLSGPSPSWPGDYPGLVKGDLRNSLYSEVDPRAMSVKVGSNSPYALFLEYGTSGGKTLVAAPGKVFSWIDPFTKERRYSRTIRVGRMKPRPFLRRAFREQRSQMTAILTSPTAFRTPGGAAMVAGVAQGR
jgi:HK97 gp10 family phage protein